MSALLPTDGLRKTEWKTYIIKKRVAELSSSVGDVIDRAVGG